MSDQENSQPLAVQVGLRAKWIVDNIPGEPSQSQGAVATATRIMLEQKAEHLSLRQRLQDAEARLKDAEAVIGNARNLSHWTHEFIIDLESGKDGVSHAALSKANTAFRDALSQLDAKQEGGG